MKDWFFPIKRVEQGDWNGCGIASVAAICSVTYWRARAEFFPLRRQFRDDPTLHVAQDHMVRVIERLGFSAEIVSNASFKRRAAPAITCFSWVPDIPGNAFGIHAIVWDPFKKVFIDPGPDNFRNLPARKYLELIRKSNFNTIVITGKKDSK